MYSDRYTGFENFGGKVLIAQCLFQNHLGLVATECFPAGSVTNVKDNVFRKTEEEDGGRKQGES